MRVLGIDPGYDRLGIAVMEKRNGSETLLFSSCIITSKTRSQSERLLELERAVTKLITEHTPDRIGIERLFFNKNRKTGIGVAEARGVVLAAAERGGCPIDEFGPQEVKVAVTGYGGSDKLAVITMVKQLVRNAPKKALDDEYDAIAIALTCLAHARGE